MVIDAGPEPTPSIAPSRAVGGVRAGVVVLSGVIALNAGNYLFHLIAARRLGPAGYGDLATLITLSSLISLPLGGVQIWVARYVAQREAADDADAIRWFVRRLSLSLALLGAACSLVFVALAWPIQHALGIASLSAVVLTALTVFPALVTPLPWGVAQGLQRFGLVALAYASGPVARLLLVGIAFEAGMQVEGAMLATLASMLVALILPIVALREWWRPSSTAERHLDRPRILHSLVPVMIGLLAVTALTSDDVVVAKAALTSHEAGIYGSASLVGRVILYLPSAIITVLLPRVAARVASRRATEDLLRRSVAVTFAFCVSGTLIYAAVGVPITRIAFGEKYVEAGHLLWLFGIAMTAFAILNVLLIYHLALEQARMSWLLLGGALIQVAAFGAIHGTGRQLIGIDIAVGIALVIAHEVVVDNTLTRGLIPKRLSAYGRRR
jgi:O-antigen/teichoic acid export membrane protein